MKAVQLTAPPRQASCRSPGLCAWNSAAPGVRVSTIDPGLAETEFSLVRFKGDSTRAKKVYEGLQPLTAEDIADILVWVATRPPHVNIDELLVKPVDQAAVYKVHRKPS